MLVDIGKKMMLGLALVACLVGAHAAIVSAVLG